MSNEAQDRGRASEQDEPDQALGSLGKILLQLGLGCAESVSAN